MLQDAFSFSSDTKPSTETFYDTRLKYIAVRFKRVSDAEIAFAASDKHRHKRKLVSSRLEKRDPALRNFTEGLEKHGLQIRVDQCPLYWYLVEDDNNVEYYLERNEVECAFSAEWFDEFKKSIRYLQGAHYVNKCMELAEAFPIKDQYRAINYKIS